MTEIKRLFDFAYYQLENKPSDKALVTKYDGKWTAISTKEYLDKANAISRALLKMGVKKDEKIALIASTNRTEWNIMDIATLQIGVTNVPIYPTICAEDYEYVLNHSESTYCFVSDAEVLEKLNKVKANTKLKEVYSFDHIEGCKHYSELFELTYTKALQSVNTKIDEIEKMLNEYLQFTSSTFVEKDETFDISELIEDIIKKYNNKDISNKIIPRIYMSGRKNLIKRSINNLIDNSIKYAKKIEIQLNKKNNNITITLDDDGIGIPKNEYQNVFKPFYKIDKGRADSKSSVGLGLAITSDIIKSHGGNIILEKSHLNGLRVKVFLPL